MKKLFLAITAVLISANLFSQGITFEQGTFDEALAKAKAENKMVFMDCYTVWCGPCKMLSQQVFPQKEVGDFFNANFVSIKMDMEKGEGIELGKKYGVKAFPTLLWLDAEGNIQHKAVGAMQAPALVEIAKTSLDTEKNWASYVKKYNSGERSIAFLQEYILTAAKLYEDVKEAAEAYYAQRKTEELINAKDAEIIAATVKSISDDKFNFVLENKEKFYEVGDKAKINKFIEQAMMNDLMPALRSGDEAALESKKKQLLDLDEFIASKLFANIEVRKLYRDPDKNKFFDALADFCLKYSFDESQTLNQYAWMIIDAKVEVKEEIMKKALKMAKRSVDLDTNFANTDTYAFGLYKSGMADEAMTFAKKSVELAPEDQKKDLWSLKYVNGELE